MTDLNENKTYFIKFAKAEEYRKQFYGTHKQNKLYNAIFIDLINDLINLEPVFQTDKFRPFMTITFKEKHVDNSEKRLDIPSETSIEIFSRSLKTTNKNKVVLDIRIKTKSDATAELTLGGLTAVELIRFKPLTTKLYSRDIKMITRELNQEAICYLILNGLPIQDYVEL